MVELSHPNGKKVAVMNLHTTSGMEVLESGLGKKGVEAAGLVRANAAGLQQLLEAFR